MSFWGAHDGKSRKEDFFFLDYKNNFLRPRIIKTAEYLIWGSCEDSYFKNKIDNCL